MTTRANEIRERWAITGNAPTDIAYLLARVEELEKALKDLVEDVTDKDHFPHDWSQHFYVKNARTALEER